MNYQAIARDQLENFKDIMRRKKEGALHPVALIIKSSSEQMFIVMEFRTPEEEEIILKNLAEAVRGAGAVAVILFGTASTFIPAYGNDPVPLLFASIYVPDEEVYTIGLVYTVIEGEPLFGEEFTSSERNISPWQVPAFWETSA